jgi:hypothetical protein
MKLARRSQQMLTDWSEGAQQQQQLCLIRHCAAQAAQCMVMLRLRLAQQQACL